jgi:hypothetical protein
MLTLEGASCGTLLRHVPRRGQIMSISIFEFYRQMTWWWFLLNNKFILQRNPFFQWHITVPDVPLFNEQELMVPCNSHLNILLELPRGYEPNVWRITGRKLGFGNRVHNHVKTRTSDFHFMNWSNVRSWYEVKCAGLALSVPNISRNRRLPRAIQGHDLTKSPPDQRCWTP